MNSIGPIWSKLCPLVKIGSNCKDQEKRGQQHTDVQWGHAWTQRPQQQQHERGLETDHASPGEKQSTLKRL